MRPQIAQSKTAPNMTPQAVLEIIDQARRQEARSGTFFRQMKAVRLRLPSSVVVDSNQQSAHCLFRFAVEYIEMAPRLIECVDACAAEAGCKSLFAPFTDAAIRYFTQPSAQLLRYEGLDGLLIRAYQCHRLMEDMHDNNRSIRASELFDLEAVRANLLVHQIIGEPFANELDEAITMNVLKLAGSPDFYDLDLEPFIQQVNNRAWDWMRDYWENLLVRNHIYFALGSYR